MYVFQYIDENNTMWCTIKIRLVIRLINVLIIKLRSIYLKLTKTKIM